MRRAIIVLGVILALAAAIEALGLWFGAPEAVTVGLVGAILASSVVPQALTGPYLATPEHVDDRHLVYLAQGWPDDQRRAFYARPQGTAVMPIAWFLALEESDSGTLLSDADNLNRYGFITDGVSANPHGLPIGFTALSIDLEGNGKFQEVLGFGCALCHTGQLNYRGAALRIDGGGAMMNVPVFRQRLAFAVLANYYLPWKWRRFADRVTKHEASAAERQQLASDLAKALDAARDGLWTGLTKQLYPSSLGEGYGRLDALQRIANTLMGDDLGVVDNNRAGDAPVHYPPLWDIPKFNWVQYNASVRQPMIRNVGEALGVRAQTFFLDPGDQPRSPSDPHFWASSIPVRALRDNELAIRQLKPPVWDERVAALLGPIDPTKAAAGKVLYQEICAHCHAPRPYAIAFADQPIERWQLVVVPSAEVGTDRQHAENFISRTYDAQRLGQTNPITGGLALWLATEKVKQYQYENGNALVQPVASSQRTAPPVPAAERPEFDGYGLPNAVRAPCGYKARPLIGIWASPPYLHNGSVPTIYDLLSPLAERPSDFWLGRREYDPVKLGYVVLQEPGATRVNTAVDGNRNAGHLFSDTKGPGVIGRGLRPEERFQIIEYLKSMREDADMITTPGKPDDPKDYPCSDNGQFWSTATAP